MRLFAVTLFVEADDSVGAVTAACDLAANEENVQALAALADGTVVIRPARRNEGPAR